MKAEPDDSLDLFVDILTTTLACIMFIGLLLALLAESSVAGEEDYFAWERRSGLLERQLAAAQAENAELAQRWEHELAETATSRGVTPEELATRLEADRGARWSAMVEDLPPEEFAARRRENERHLQFLALAPWREAVVEFALGSLADRLDRAHAEAAAAPVGWSTLEERPGEVGRPLYWVVKNERLFNLGWPGGPPEAAQWTREAGAGASRWRAELITENGRSLAGATPRLEEMARLCPTGGARQIVLFVYPDSFPEARETLALLAELKASFSWKPMAADRPLIMREGGAPPPPPQ